MRQPKGKESERDRSKIDSQIIIEEDDHFDEVKIIQHYMRLKDSQQERLANINLSEQLKRKLFGFSEGYYLTNTVDPYELVVENHPMKGRIIMHPIKYHRYLLNKNIQNRIKSKFGTESDQKMFSDNQEIFEDDLDKKSFQYNNEQHEVNNNQNNQSSGPMKSEVQLLNT